MPLKVFLTGATGYIGGEAFVDLHEKHPEYEYALLIRDEEKGRSILNKYPKVRLVPGTLDSSDVIEKEAAAADVVVDTADSADHVGAATAIVKGLAAGHSPEKPAYWIHISGTGILTWYDKANNRAGQPPLPAEKYGDITDIDRVLNLPDQAPHRNVDKIVLAANSPSVRIAIVGPPTIYGAGRGPGNTVSIQVPRLIRWTLENGFAPVIGAGTEWDHVHVHDLGAFLVTLVEATQDPAKNADPELFGPQAYYFLESGTHKWVDVAEWIAAEAARQGYLPAPTTKSVTIEEAISSVHGSRSWGQNSKSVAERARKYFGWTPKGESLKDSIPGAVEQEATRLGLHPNKSEGFVGKIKDLIN